MYQQEIRFFWPLTEQIELDLDFTPCEEFARNKYTNSLASGNGLLLTARGTGTVSWANVVPNTFQFKPDPDAVGYWSINKDVLVWRKERPNWLHQKMTKFFFGWEWSDK